ncbi:MAG: DUF4145 domain-containing protein [Deltaproteobacteria bacterium]|nr:DUF4145 domain-containing protein [Deltaproteobacteria bacterium]
MSDLKCPICDTAAAFTPIYLAINRVLDYLTGTQQVGVSVPGVIPAVMKQSVQGVEYAILCCQKCDGVFVVANLSDGKGWRVVHPIPHKPASDKIPPRIKSEFEEASLCFAIGAHRACAAMCQRTLESLSQNKKVSGLNQLLEKGIISQGLFDRATEIRLWAGIVKHEPITESVSKDDAEELITYLEDIINHVYVEQARYEALKQKREQMGKKAAKK